MTSTKVVYTYVVTLLLLTAIAASKYEYRQKPNIVIIMADDMGWNDVSFHGSNEIPTPNIDALAYGGIILNRHYTAPMCTPSRAALMTGRHPVSIGMQHYVIDSDEPWGLGLDQKIMPEYFKEAGYKTHMVGKWHLGFFAKQYTPTMRGFDSHIGYLGPFVDYWNFTLKMPTPGKNYVGYDMRHNLDVDWHSNGTYATDHFTSAAGYIINKHDPNKPLLLVVNHLAPHAGNDDDPLQAPEETIAKFSHISAPDRRIYAAMMTKLDESVGEIVKSLERKNMLENSIILFISDNGAPSVGLHANAGSNYPLRGQKNSPWEGATRNVAAIWSPLLVERHRVSNQFFHISDWLPTLASAAGIRIPLAKDHTEVDGIDQWEALSYDTGNPRRVILNMIDEIFGYSSYMENGLKYVNGTTQAGKFDNWYGQLNKSDCRISDYDYISQVLATSIAQWPGAELSSDLIKHVRKHARVSCGRQFQPKACNPLVRPCLFDIINDPCEQNDVSDKYYYLFRELHSKVEFYRRVAKKPRNKSADPAANPANFGGVWNWWRPDMSPKELAYLQAEEESYVQEIPPPHSRLPEDIQLSVIITIVVVGILFVTGALLYLSNKDVLRICRCRKVKDKLAAEATGRTTTLSPSDLGSNEGKFRDVLCQPPLSTTRPNPKVYHISDNSLDRY